MPTGYTYPVAEGKITTLRDFALTCARAMGATIMMRDEPFDAPIPERFEPSTEYHDERIETAKALLAELLALSAEECEERALAAYEEARTSHRSYEEKREAENSRIKWMLSEVEAWETQADGIKGFMLEQLRMSVDDYRSDPPSLSLDGRKWQSTAVQKAAKELAYHKEERAKEIARTEQRNRWLADLRASLPAALASTEER